MPENIPTNIVDMPFTHESNRVLSFAADEADRLGHQLIGAEHLLLGLLREEDCVAARMLRERGANIEQICKELVAAPHEPTPIKERMLREIEEIRKISATAPPREFRNPKKATWATSKFEHYTEKARRSIFFAQHEASQFGSPLVESEHLLLGVLREDKEHLDLFLPSAASRETIRTQIEVHAPPREKVSTSADLPLSSECKRVLAFAEEEAELLSQELIGPGHLLLGLLREEGCVAAHILRERGAELERIRRGLTAPRHWPPQSGNY